MKASTVDQRGEDCQNRFAHFALPCAWIGIPSSRSCACAWAASLLGKFPRSSKSFESHGCTHSHQFGLPAMLVLTMIQVPWSPTALKTPPTWGNHLSIRDGRVHLGASPAEREQRNGCRDESCA